MSEENRDSGIEPQPDESQARTRIQLSTPWGDTNIGQSIDFTGDRWRGIDAFVTGRSRVHSTYIREEWKTKRLSLILATIFALAACVLVVFAPAGREILAYGIGVALFISAAGAAGYKRVWFKSKNTSLRLHTDE